MRQTSMLLAGALLCLTLAAAGCVTGSGSTSAASASSSSASSAANADGREKRIYQPRQVDLDGRSLLAAVTLDLARNGILPSGPLVTMAPDATVALAPAPAGFRETDRAVTGADQLGDGLYALEAARRYEDGLGRRAAFLDLAVYTLFDPENSELNRRAEELRSAYVAAMRSNDPAMRQAMARFVTDFQNQYGLRADGALTPQTAMAMAAATPVQTFQILASTPLYAETPRYEIHLLDETYGRNAPDTYLKGFDSLPAIRGRAVPEGQYQAAAAKGGRYLIMVHFLDQLPPGTPVQVALSPNETRKGTDRKAASPMFYADGRSWPVLVVPATLKGVTGKLWVHVLVNDAILGSIRLK
ncbi:hypothetical protein DND132_1539 [Pseudodesulfovibrio mercurii]|uniref:Lipoprotein n=1 Tax=Pseudodesulfovibrio mercurii TaxID=641491 RepID=F0JEL7_9BACT|nr:hypothetical protein [Pseudodesulfovibrio mercurii]EGB14746.1 hypothetical protein DND132_1539 [Pseudodesulfovibrio mercurii]